MLHSAREKFNVGGEALNSMLDDIEANPSILPYMSPEAQAGEAQARPGGPGEGRNIEG